ncbi:armadillo-type protein [Mycena metata]|uniref:Vacuolar protein 8 n=1 Tax=Mycena metata TaxID=1033252 RepID=A0AAD7MM65_9AGAR|nr:armadillo-type protein [Mycena metata]
MPPPRPATPQSIHSWWSDSKPLGATLSLHAAAKPLMRLMYHRQARLFVERNTASPLSTPMIDVYLSYLEYKYIAVTTKVLVLKELDRRARDDAGDARALIDSLAMEWDLLESLLSSPYPAIRSSTCWIFGHLASRESSATPMLNLKPCERLLPLLLEDENSAVVESALFALWGFTEFAEGARAIVSSGQLERILNLLDSPGEKIRRWLCGMLGNLVRHEQATVAALTMSTCPQLLALISDEYMPAPAMDVLLEISKWPDGAQKVVDAGILESISSLLGSEFDRPGRTSACKVLGYLVRCEFVVEDVIASKPLAALVLLLSDEKIQTEIVLSTIRESSLRSGALDALAATDILDHLLQLVDSPNPRIRQWTCEILARLAHKASATTIVAGSTLSILFAQLFRGNGPFSPDNIRLALSEVSEASIAPDGEVTRMDPNIADSFLYLLASAEGEIPVSSRQMVADFQILHHSSTRTLVTMLKSRSLDLTLHILKELGTRALHKEQGRTIADAFAAHSNLFPNSLAVVGIIGSQVGFQLVSMLRESSLQAYSLQILCRISKILDGAQAVVAGKALEHVLDLLASPSAILALPSVCDQLARLLRYVLTSRACGISSRPALLRLWINEVSDEEERVIECEMYALSGLRQWYEGARTFADSIAAETVSVLENSLNSRIRTLTSQIMESLANQEPLGAILEEEASLLAIIK